MSLYEQINDEVTLMDAGEQKWIGQDLPLEAMVAVRLLLQDLLKISKSKFAVRTMKSNQA